MFNNPVPVSPEQHSAIKIRQQGTIEHLVDRQFAPVFFGEFSKVSAHYPIFFVYEEQSKQYRPIAVFGLLEKQNLFLHQGRWDASYVPASLRSYPFSIARAENTDDQWMVCIHPESELVSNTEGQAIFDANKQPTEFYQNLTNFLQDLLAHEMVSVEITTLVQQLDLFKEEALKFTDSAGKQGALNGFHVIDQEKLAALSDSDFLKLRQHNALDAIYHHLSSLDRVSDLVRRLG